MPRRIRLYDGSDRNYDLLSIQLRARYVVVVSQSNNSLCRLFGHAAQNELKDLQSCAIEQQPNVAVFILLDKFFFLVVFLVPFIVCYHLMVNKVLCVCIPFPAFHFK